MKKFLNSLKSKNLRIGGYSVVSVIIVLVVIVLINVVVNALPAKLRLFDVSQNMLYSFSDQTKKIVSAADRDITIYQLAKSGYEEDTLISMLDRYAALSSRITLKLIDPDDYPTFAETYGISSVKDNSLIVESDLRFRYIPYNDIFVTEYITNEEDGSYYAMASLNGEEEITSAIHYVLTDEVPVAYQLSGHGEAELPESYVKALEQENMSVETLSLLSVAEIPENCDILIINAPQSEISDKEAEMITDYLAGGGRMMLVTFPYTDENEKIKEIMASYNVTQETGIVVEGDINHYISTASPAYIIPIIESSEITDPLNENHYFTFTALAGALKTKKANEGETITKLLTSSEESFVSMNVETYEKQEGDIEGPFSVAVLVEQTDLTYENDQDTMIVWVSSSSMTDEKMNEVVSGGNLDFFLNAMSYMSGESNSIAIHSKSLMTRRLMVPSGHATAWTIVLEWALPVLILAAGVAVYMWRRKK